MTRDTVDRLAFSAAVTFAVGVYALGPLPFAHESWYYPYVFGLGVLFAYLMFVTWKDD